MKHTIVIEIEINENKINFKEVQINDGYSSWEKERNFLYRKLYYIGNNFLILNKNCQIQRRLFIITPRISDHFSFRDFILSWILPYAEWFFSVSFVDLFFSVYTLPLAFEGFYQERSSLLPHSPRRPHSPPWFPQILIYWRL